MIESFHVTQDADKIALYSGMLITAFAFAEFSTGMIWGRISDRVGRKKVLIMGLVGTALSMTFFGFATNLTTAVIARALGGLLNGNVGVLQTTVAELVKKKEHQPRAYSIMPFVWCLGSIIGPALGGALAMPCDSYPTWFHKGSIFDRYPFLLPNLVCVVILLCGIVTGILFIEETHPVLKDETDHGRKLGDFLVNRLCGRFFRSTDRVSYSLDEKTSITYDDPPDYRSTENSPRLSSTQAPQSTDLDTEAVTERLNNGFTKTFNKQIICVIIGYGILAFHSVSYDAMMPVMLSEEPSTIKPKLPFKFVGGFGMSTKSIGFMLAVQGVYSMIAQLWLFPFIVKRLGTLTAFRSVMFIWPLLYFVVPYIVLLPAGLQSIGIYAALLIKITFHVIAFPAVAILLANSVPSKAVLGTVNGVAASTACLCRAFGPTISGSIHSAGLRLGCGGFAWWAAGIICALGAIESFLIEEVDSYTGQASTPTEKEPAYEQLISVEEDEDFSDTDLKTDELDLNTSMTDKEES